MIDNLNLTIQKAELANILNDTYLKTKKSIIVFWKIPNND